MPSPPRTPKPNFAPAAARTAEDWEQRMMQHTRRLRAIEQGPGLRYVVTAIPGHTSASLEPPEAPVVQPAPTASQPHTPTPNSRTDAAHPSSAVPVSTSPSPPDTCFLCGAPRLPHSHHTHLPTTPEDNDSSSDITVTDSSPIRPPTPA